MFVYYYIIVTPTRELDEGFGLPRSEKRVVRYCTSREQSDNDSLNFDDSSQIDVGCGQTPKE